MTNLTLLDPPDCGCDSAAMGDGLITVPEALMRIDDLVVPVAGIEAQPLAMARERVLAASVDALAEAPRFDASAMDGFAIRCGDLSGPGPWQLPVIGQVAAGQSSPDPLPVGAAVRIFTGAPVPPGADTVVMQEDVQQDGDRVKLHARPRPGAHIRRRGEDMAANAKALSAGCRLTPRDLAVAAAAGHDRLSVRRGLRVALIVTGDELSAQAGAGIPDVNGPMLRAALDRPDIASVEMLHLGDDPAALAEALGRVAPQADLIVTTGGLSVGAADHVKPVLRGLGLRMGFEKVAIKPGKPVSLGMLGDAVWLGLPGNPVSALVTWAVFGTRVLDRLTGCTRPGNTPRTAVLAAPLTHRPGRCEFRFARVAGSDGQGRQILTCPDTTHSARVLQMAGADGLILIPAETEILPQGGLVDFWPLANC